MAISTDTSYIVSSLTFTASELEGGVTIAELKAAMARTGIHGKEAAGLLAMFRMADRADGTRDNSLSEAQLTSLTNRFCGQSADEVLGNFQAITQGDRFLTPGWTSDDKFVKSIFSLISNVPPGVGSGGLLNADNFKAWLDSLNLPNSQKVQLMDQFNARTGTDGYLNEPEFLAFMEEMGNNGLFDKSEGKAINGQIRLGEDDKIDLSNSEYKTKRYADKLFTTCSTGMYVNQDEFATLFGDEGPLRGLSQEQINKLKKDFEKFCSDNGVSTHGATREQFQQFWAQHAPT